MKIAMYVPEWPPGLSANGIVTYASYMVPALRDLGHEVFVLTPSDLKKYERPLSFWHRTLFKISPTDAHRRRCAAPLVWALRDLVASKGVEIVEIEETFGISEVISKLKLIPVCVRLHGPWFLNHRYKERRRERLEGNAIRAADFVTSPSQIMLDLVAARYGLNSTRTAAFPNPISIPAQQWERPEVQNILFIGRFDKIKGADLAIKAFGALAREYPKLRLTFVGPDDEIDGDCLLDFARKLLPQEYVERIDYLGKLSHEKIAKLRLRHFITICASRYEVFGYTVLEAMAFGCPVVASNAGGIPEMIDHGVNGLLFEAGKVEPLIENIRFLLNSPALAEKLGSAARFSAHLYKPEQMAIYTAEFYRQAIERFKTRDRPRGLYETQLRHQHEPPL